jgi:hypothetical protein
LAPQRTFIDNLFKTPIYNNTLKTKEELYTEFIIRRGNNQSIYNMYFINKQELIHQDYNVNSVLTTNFYKMHLSSNKYSKDQLHGLFLCYYEASYSFETFLIP